MAIFSLKSAKRLTSLSLLLAMLSGCGSDVETDTQIDVTGPSQPVSDWQMVWEDNFDGNAIDTSNWTHEVNCQGGGNQEQQCYTDSPENSFVADGMLNIVAKPSTDGEPLPYTSARLNTSGKVDFRYGRVEMRAKLPFGQGSWPAFWMLPTDYVYGGWPKSGEIDILEAVNLKTVDADGAVENRVYGTLHYGDDAPNNRFSGEEYSLPNNVNPADDFHTYAIEWQEGEIRWYVDGYLYATQQQSEVRFNSNGDASGLSHQGWYLPQFSPITGEQEVVYGKEPFDQDFHLILNLAVGGNFPENTNNGGIDPTAFADGQTFQIDYVRVYECSVDPSTGKGCETVRSGYDQYKYEQNGDLIDENNALIRGAAPIPRAPSAPSAEPLTIFADEENPAWPLWDDCCGPAESEVVTDDEEHGAVAEFRILDNSGTVLGFNNRNGNGSPYNASALVGNGNLSFEMKVVNPPSTPDTTWLIKIEGAGIASPAFEVALSTSIEGQAPVVGEWQTYTFPVQDIFDAGVDVTAIDVVMIFPLWQTGEGAVYRIDNMVFAPASLPSLTIFDDQVDSDWAIWDNCCGAAASAVVEDDADRGDVVEFQILDATGTVLGFNAREGIGSGNAFNAVPIESDGVLQFDMKIVTPPGDTTWLVKIEGAETPDPAFEEALSASMEGAEPVVGEWQTYTFSIADIRDAGVDITAIDAVLVFPTWQTGNGAVYRVDNVRIYSPSGGQSSSPLLTAFTDAENPDWPLWDDCCGPAESEVVSDDDEHGAVAEFRILDGSGTVLGFNSRNGTSEAAGAFDASSIIDSGVLTFEMKIVNPPASDTNWLVKVEGAASPEPFFEVNLNTSMEGQDPVVGEWQTYTFPLSALSNTGIDMAALDVIMIFPLWQTGAGAVYRVDNVFIGNPSDISGATPAPDPGDGGTPPGGDPGDGGGSAPISFGVGEEQISNGGFDDDINSWSGGTVIAEGDNYVYFAEVSTAGNPWDVNLSQGMTLLPYRNYMLSFRAKASQARSIIAGLGLNHDPWTAVTENVALTTEWQTFTLLLTTMDEEGNGFGDDNSRVLFDMGAEVGDVYLDDVSVVFDSELLVNRSFDMGIAGWSGGNTVTEDENSYYAATVATAGNPWDVNLSQVVTLVPNTEYTLTFRARATQSRSIIAGIGLNQDPWNAATQSVELTTEWQTFELTLNSVDDNGIAFGNDNSRALFDLGAEAGDVHLDDISLVQGPAEIVTNGGFDDDINNWNAGTVVEEDGNYFYQADVTAAGNPWDVSLSQVLTLQPDSHYILRFRAKSNVERGIIAGIGFNHDPWTAVTETAVLTTEWQTFTYDMTTIDPDGNGFGDDDSRVLFDMGAEVGMVSLDDVSLKRIGPAE